jgi:hypothetical protein
MVDSLISEYTSCAALHQWRDLADQYGFFLLVPEFGRPAYLKSRQYNLGNLIDKSGQVRDKSS